jgi:hypothetical protein
MIRAFAYWILRTFKPREDEIDEAIRYAFAQSGLNQDDYHRDYDLLHSGKLNEILFHATNKLGNPLITVNDLRDLLK